MPVRMSISSTDSCGRPLRKRRGLDAEPGDGPAERDRLQLRHHQRRQPVRERGGDEVLVRAHPGHIGGPGVGVDRDDARQPRGVQAREQSFLARARNRLEVCFASRTEAVAGIIR